MFPSRVTFTRAVAGHLRAQPKTEPALATPSILEQQIVERGLDFGPVGDALALLAAGPSASRSASQRESSFSASHATTRMSGCKWTRTPMPGLTALAGRQPASSDRLPFGLTAEEDGIDSLV